MMAEMQKETKKNIIRRALNFFIQVIITMVWINYYLLVIFVLYNIYRVISFKMQNPEENATLGIPFKDRIQYYWSRLKTNYFR
mmetsp:Transcript_17630/g.16866  ORF Transcript_17630/g.16866 Transcript_17630/m.16866 type:complete len:83 (+) Transcript_17630:643-891(+)